MEVAGFEAANANGDYKCEREVMVNDRWWWWLVVVCLEGFNVEVVEKRM